MKERSLVLIKPDAVQRALVGEIISRIEKTTLKVIGMKMVYATPELAGEHYEADEEWLRAVGEKSIKSYEEKGTPIDTDPMEIGHRIRQQLMDFISMSPIVAICVEGYNAVATVRKLVGATAPEHSAVGSIRGDFAVDGYSLADVSGRPLQNLIHASGESKDAEREIKIWFKDDELHAYYRVDEALVYRKVGKE